MQTRAFGAFVALLMGALAVVSAQQVTKKDVAGISTFAQVGTTIACGGATKVEAIPELKAMGFKSVINVRQRGEEGADVDEEGVAVRQAGM